MDYSGHNGPSRRQVLATLAVAGVGMLVGIDTVRAAPGDLKWRFETNDSVFSSPTVVDGTVFIGSADAHLYALDDNSGDKQWAFDSDEAALSSAAETNQKQRSLYASTDDHAYTANTSSGNTSFSLQVAPSRILSSPTVLDGTAFFSSDDDHTYALDITTGDIQWTVDASEFSSQLVTYSVGARTIRNGTYKDLLDITADDTLSPLQMSLLIPSSPTVVEGTVFVGTADGQVYALDSNSGDTQWVFSGDQSDNLSTRETTRTRTFATCSDDMYKSETKSIDTLQVASRMISSPTVVDGSVFVGSHDNNIYALDASSGDEQWTFETGGPIWSSPTVANGTVFVGSHDNHIYAVDTSSGNERWSFESDDTIQSSPTVVGGTVFVGSHNNHIYALDASSGDEKWSFEANDVIQSSPTVVDETVFVGSYDNHVYALDASSGDNQWSFETDGPIWSSPTVVDGTVFVGSHDNQIYAIETGLEGSSRDSRVLLGTLGHHNRWTGEMPPAQFAPGDDDHVDDETAKSGDNDSDNTSNNSTGDSDNTSNNSTGDSDDDTAENDDSSGPGFGISSALAGVGGAVYLLKRELVDDETGSE